MPTKYDYATKCEIAAFKKPKVSKDPKKPTEVCVNESFHRFYVLKGLRKNDAFLCSKHVKLLRDENWSVK